MTEKELQEFLRAIENVNAQYPGREGALKLLMEEGVLDADGKLTKHYAEGVEAVRKEKEKQKAKREQAA